MLAPDLPDLQKCSSSKCLLMECAGWNLQKSWHYTLAQDHPTDHRKVQPVEKMCQIVMLKSFAVFHGGLFLNVKQ